MKIYLNFYINCQAVKNYFTNFKICTYLHANFFRQLIYYRVDFTNFYFRWDEISHFHVTVSWVHIENHSIFQKHLLNTVWKLRKITCILIYLAKISWNQRKWLYLVKKSINSWFDEISFRGEFFYFPQCGQWILVFYKIFNVYLPE